MPLDPVSIGKKIKESYPQYANVDDATIGTKYLQKYGGAISSIQSKQIDIKDIPEAQRVGVSIGLQGAGYEPPKDELSAAESKNKSAYQGAVGLLDVLEQNYTAAKGGEFSGIGAIPGGIGKNIAGALNLDKPAGIYNRQKSGFTANLKTITGDTGVMTEKDYARIESLLPKFTDDPEMATQFFKDMRQIIANKFAGETTESKYQRPELRGGALGKSDNPLLNLIAGVVPGVSEYATKDVPEYYGKGLPGSYKEQLTERSDISKKSEKAKTEIGTLSAVLGLGNAARQGLRGLSSKAALETRSRVAGESVAKVSGDDIIAQAEKKLGSVSEADKAGVQKIFDTAKEQLKGKVFTPQQALDKLTQYNKAYTTTGAAGKSGKAFFNDVMSKATREVIREVAPDVAATQEALKRSIQLPKTIRKWLMATGLVAGGVGGATYLFNALRGKGGSQR